MLEELARTGPKMRCTQTRYFLLFSRQTSNLHVKSSRYDMFRMIHVNITFDDDRKGQLCRDFETLSFVSKTEMSKLHLLYIKYI